MGCSHMNNMRCQPDMGCRPASAAYAPSWATCPTRLGVHAQLWRKTASVAYAHSWAICLISERQHPTCPAWTPCSQHASTQDSLTPLAFAKHQPAACTRYVAAVASCPTYPSPPRVTVQPSPSACPLPCSPESPLARCQGTPAGPGPRQHS